MVWASAELWIDAKWILTCNGDLRQQAFSFCFVLVGVGLGFFFNPEQIMHRSDAAIKKGHKLPFSGSE